MTRKYSLGPLVDYTYLDSSTQRPVQVSASRITALIDIPRHGVKAGDLGGFVSSKHCLSQDDDAWIAEDAYVGMTLYAFRTKNPIITGNALVTKKAVVLDSRVDQMAIVTENAFVHNSIIRGFAAVGGNAIVTGSELLDQSGVAERSIIRRSLLQDRAAVTGSAVIGSSKLAGKATVTDSVVISSSTLRDDVYASEEARVSGSHLINKVFVTGRCSVQRSFITGDTEIIESVTVAEGSYLEGNNTLSGKLYILPGSHIRNENIHGDVSRYSYNSPQEIHRLADGVPPVRVDATLPHTPDLSYPPVPAEPERLYPDGNESNAQKMVRISVPASTAAKFRSSTQSMKLRLDDMIDAALAKEIFAFDKNKEVLHLEQQRAHDLKKELSSRLAEEFAPTDELQGLIDIVEGIENAYNEYTTDVVKLIKYPLMSDLSVPEVENFVICLRKTKRVLLTGNPEKIAYEVDLLERAFIKAESKVLTAQQTTLSAENRKKLQSAEKMFAIVFDDGAAKNEKQMSLKAGMKALEGVVHVSDKAITAVKEKAGLLAIEA